MEVPRSSGPASVAARLVTVVAGSAAPGATVPVTGRIEVERDSARIVTVPDRSALLVVRAGRIVGRVDGGPGPEVPVPLRAGRTWPAQSLPGSLRLVDGGDGSDLPPGDYTVIGVLGYGGDPLATAPSGGSGRAFVLVSEPAPITIG